MRTVAPHADLRERLTGRATVAGFQSTLTGARTEVTVGNCQFSVSIVRTKPRPDITHAEEIEHFADLAAFATSKTDLENWNAQLNHYVHHAIGWDGRSRVAKFLWPWCPQLSNWNNPIALP